ncbi:16S rRNA (guanine(966)-N(2))-methyltransferase RsmD [Orrella sp. NBD-18]|uniref:16S rRNA (Guanine(966)-N(2))-methyltransferase RsmD n=2 Tax=Sheuella amnicola TaxID=2707330 RepID=A0A6B2QX75_9BURK|nr:16S rRNA (guanine(966)-N(2))-methyltransferase RsmD [Sheuella amnicola]NDY83256.1 16S rRNA (guanine(966)-N(2))-methyltransferase RsmD [Sheuella amnicola]
MKKYIRIVGGQYRRTPIEVIDAPGLRPTPDRVRETLFNWLNYFWGGRFDDKRVLDLFAGSGALGFEAASRGVAHVQMVEQNPKAAATLRALRDKLGANAVRIHIGDACVAIKRLEAARFDLIFLDPPFGANWLDRLWKDLPDLLEPNGLVYIEAEKAISPPQGFTLLRQDRAGVVHYQLIQIDALQK